MYRDFGMVSGYGSVVYGDIGINAPNGVHSLMEGVLLAGFAADDISDHFVGDIRLKHGYSSKTEAALWAENI